MDGAVVNKLRAMARSGRPPHEIAEALWSGAANGGTLVWMVYMRAAFDVPLRVLKGLGAAYEPDDLDGVLAPWINPSTSRDSG